MSERAVTRTVAAGTPPPRPQIAPDELSGAPFVLEPRDSAISWRYTLGWLRCPDRKGGPCFAVVKNTFLAGLRPVERFPLTDAGWARAWKALVRRDPDGAAMAAGVLAARDRVAEDRDRLAGLESQTLGYLADVLYLAGSGELPGLAAGSRCDVRFLADRVLFLPPGSSQEAGVIGYPDLEDVEVGGPGRVERFSPGQQAALGLAFGVEGALLAQRATSLKTVVRFQSARCELFVVDSRTAPEVLRMELSRALWAVREARGTAGLPAGVAADPDADLAAGPAAGRASSVVDQLTKLAALLDSGLLTRDEFDWLKADLLAGRAPPD